MQNYQLNAIVTAISSNKITDTLLNEGVSLGIVEGSLRHKEVRKELALYLGRNLNAGERRRLAYLCIGTKQQSNTVALTANTTHKALSRVPSNTDIRASKAVKNVV